LNKRTACAEKPQTRSSRRAAARDTPSSRTAGDLAPLRPLYEAGDYARVIESDARLIEANPQYPEPMFNVAAARVCSATRAAARTSAPAIEPSDRMRSFAKEDSDLDPIRDEAAFKELVGK
jgi:hypothetical protein